MIEIVALLLAFALGLVWSSTRDSLAGTAFALGFTGYVVISRVVGLEGDLMVYRAAFEGADLSSPYYWREPVVWGLGALIARTTGSSIVAFLFLDCVSALAVYVASYNPNRRKGRTVNALLLVTVLMSFQYFLGQQNVLRQHVATALLLAALLTARRNRVTSAITMVIAVLAHNSTAVFGGLWISLGARRPWAERLGRFCTFIGALGLSQASNLLQRVLPGFETGLNTTALYIVLICAIGFVAIMVHPRFDIAHFGGLEVPIHLLAFLPALSAFPGVAAERLLMIWLLVFVSEILSEPPTPLRPRAEFRNQLWPTILFMPILLFTSSRAFLG